MRTSLGISAGKEVVCSALVTTAPNGAQSFDYRMVSADVAHSDLGDLVASSIELMTTQMPRDVAHLTGSHHHSASGIPSRSEATGPPGAIAVAYRDREQAVAIRSAVGRRRDVQLIDEGTAALTYLRHTGLLDQHETVAIIDFGATGTSVTVADLAEEAVLRCERTPTVSGRAIDELIYHHLLDCHFARRGTRPNRSMLINRSRAAKEHLSISPAVTIDHVAGRPLKLTRADFEELILDLLHESANFVAGVFSRAPKRPRAAAVIGGGANIPAVAASLRHLLDIPVLTLAEPEAITAKGAALVADAMQPTAAGGRSDAPGITFGKLVGTFAGAVAVVGLVVGYGVKELSSTGNHDFSPVGTSNSAPLTTPPTTVDPAPSTLNSATHQPPQYNTPSNGGADASPQNTVPLRPDPNLPQIPFPDLPHLLGPLLNLDNNGNHGQNQGQDHDWNGNYGNNGNSPGAMHADSQRPRLNSGSPHGR
ncbi:Hsp70 family protein [Nocardia stercoris]|uniref:Hsp70 family protein n=1 Tax=Nocardia stercoris TaxID=2483361 RepID=A0A3M2L2S5_9NOCA|nr:Hsp70 family protein [Nocardia stercoris]RMI31957.1 hypothetical protein EBN03_16630 [Nocardia stercoris]